MTAEEKRNVERYLKTKQNGRCRKHIEGEKVKCDECSSAMELEWHHKKYWSEGGNDEPENLAILCKPCHTKLHSHLNDFKTAGKWGGLVSAYVREKRMGREKFCDYMRNLAMRKT
jgi:5-methylcytosine-specific restriction endonuclease McrA